MVVDRLVERGHASWSALPKSAQQDLSSAIRGWRAAADEGLAYAQFNLGIMFEEGRGVVHSNDEAGHWYRKAADNGHDDAQYNLGVMYRNGCGVP